MTELPFGREAFGVLPWSDCLDFERASGFLEPAIKLAWGGSFAKSSTTCSRVRLVASTRSAFAASSSEMTTYFLGAMRTRFIADFHGDE